MSDVADIYDMDLLLGMKISVCQESIQLLAGLQGSAFSVQDVLRPRTFYIERRMRLLNIEVLSTSCSLQHII